MSPPHKGNLPRLERHHYQCHAVVCWTNTLEERARGWLTPSFHAAFREIMLHVAAREHLFCPAYCLMPDHLHLIWMGLRRESEQINAMKFLRTYLEPALAGRREWQHQPHDHVLREEERRRNAFASFCFYVVANPVRAKLVKRETDWLYTGAIIPGYPTLHPLTEDFWELFWRIYVRERESEPPAPQTPLLRDAL
jgi:putative transposase